MSLPAIVLNNYDPQGALSNAVRAVTGMVKLNAVTFDTDFTQYGRWIFVCTSGALSYVEWDGTTVVLPSISDGGGGIGHPIYAKRINSSGTTILASNLFWGV